MARLFEDPPLRVPNFEVEGAMPQQLPSWVDRNWKIAPPASPPWPSLTPASPQGPDPFGAPAQIPAPQQRHPLREQAPTGFDAAKWLLDALGASKRQSTTRRWSTAEPRALRRDLMPPLQWSPTEALPDRPVNLPFRVDPDLLKRMRSEDLVQPLASKRSQKRVTQPPIFFPFD